MIANLKFSYFESICLTSASKNQQGNEWAYALLVVVCGEFIIISNNMFMFPLFFTLIRLLSFTHSLHRRVISSDSDPLQLIIRETKMIIEQKTHPTSSIPE